MFRNNRLCVILVSAFLLIAGITMLSATTTEWSGAADDECTCGGRTFIPFAAWSGEWDDVANTFEGTWYDPVYEKSGTFTCTVDGNDNITGTWTCDQMIPPTIGNMWGGFDTERDTVGGSFDASETPCTCEGDWHGELDE